MKQRLYVKRDSTYDVRAFGLDAHSLESLDDARIWFETRLKYPVSQSIVCRRALRVYNEFLHSLKTKENLESELVQTIRAAKGVI